MHRKNRNSRFSHGFESFPTPQNLVLEAKSIFRMNDRFNILVDFSLGASRSYFSFFARVALLRFLYKASDVVLCLIKINECNFVVNI